METMIMTKTSSRVVDRTYLVLLTGRAGYYLTAGAVLIAFAGLLTYLWIGFWPLLFVPAWIASRGGAYIIQALEPFAGKRAAQAPATPPESRAERLRRDRQSRD